jgi:hypothetical protein
MIEGLLLFFVGIGALLVSIVFDAPYGVARRHHSRADRRRGRVRPVCTERPPVISSESAEQPHEG